MLYWKAAAEDQGIAWQGAFDAQAQATLDRSVWLVSHNLGVPVALVTIVERRRQVFQSQIGLKEPWATRSETPLSHSFCKHCVADGRCFIVEDARTDERVRENLAVPDLGVIAYLGAPLRAPSGKVIGALCAIDGAPRAWTADDKAAMEALASAVEQEFRHCAELARIRAQLAKVRRESRAQTAALAGLGRDLRPLLTPIATSVDVLRERIDTGAWDLLDVIEHSSDTLTQFADDLLEIEELERDKVEVQQNPFSPHTLLRNVVETFRHRVGPDVAIREEVAPNTPVVWTGDVRRVEQVLAHLVGNAAKFTLSGEIVLFVTLEENALVFRVRDTGPGIPLTDRNSIFDRFERGEASSERGQNGFGLGLAICRSVAARTGTILELEETRCPGGSTFRFAIPAPKA